MEIRYIDTRGNTHDPLTFSEALLKGMASGGGLFVPEQLPSMTLDEIVALAKMPYAERAAFVYKRFGVDFDDEQVDELMRRSYNENFDTPDVCPVVEVADGMYVLELWHGPTCAFKDMALQCLPVFFSACVDKQRAAGAADNDYLIAVATSGDTGKAALQGFADREHISIVVFYPDGGVSDIQFKQMATQEGDNVNVVAVRSNFDDCQSAVKQFFTSDDVKEELKKRNVILSSANSINFGRLAPQIAYYFSAYLDLVSSDQIAMGDEVNFAVPTGNFGNILAAYYAKRMGLPVKKLVCASNKNNILTDFIKTGVYDKRREFYKTMSPSMDILISSNLERLLFELSGREPTRVKLRMDKLKEEGVYEIYEEEREKIQSLFAADFCGEDETVETIYEFFEEYAYPMDTHTACAMYAASGYMAESKDETPMVVVSTASPYKFPQDVMYALTGNDIKDSFKAIKHLNLTTAMKVPKSLSKLRDKKVRFTAVADVDKLYEKVLEFVDGK